MQFEWDEGKCAANLAACGLHFRDAIPAFYDDQRKIWEEKRQDYGEVRYNMLASSEARVFAVTFTMRAGNVRIISFRKANQREVRRYGQD